MARFFIDRPVFAWVIAIIIMLAGGLAVLKLPVSMYPPIAPPSIDIRASYPGASAQVVENSVTQIIEQNLTGLDGLLYFSSNSSSSGAAAISLTFATGTDPDTAQVQVQNQVQAAMQQLPQTVQQQGVRVNKSSTGFLQVLAFYSSDGKMNRADIADYVNTNLSEPLSRVPGVGRVQVFGAKYAMRIWLNPEKLDTYKLTTNEVIAAIKGQNAQVAVGQLGGTPAVEGQQLNATINAQDRLQTVEEFRDIVIRANTDGSTLRLGDIARVELGAENYSYLTRYNGQAASGVGISLASGGNALSTVENIAALMEELKPFFPEGLELAIPFDTTPFVRVSIKGVFTTLIEAVVLVFLVMYLFLQNIRATIIPTIAVPVVLLGTFGILAALGFSINMLTMFAMVLAIGLLVDDAIVVVENVERIMSEEGLSPLEATRKSMDQITGALVGIGLVLSAVFVPMAFMSGSTGVIYRQFSATIVSAMGLSVLVAIVLTPALCATMLKPIVKGQTHEKKGFFGWFNRSFDRISVSYRGGVKGMLLRPARFMLVFALLVGFMAWMFVRLPSSFLPAEDQGVLISQVIAPVGATQERTMESIYKLEDHFMQNEVDVVQSVFSIQGFSFGGAGQNAGIAFVKLKDWSERTTPETSAGATAGRAMGAWQGLKDAIAFTFPPPAMPELGVAAGFSFFLKDNAGQGHEGLLNARNQLLGLANQSALLTRVRPNGQEDTPQFRIDIDTARASSLGLSMAEINATLSTAWGGQYIDDFIDRGRVKRVYMQADANFRMSPEDMLLWSVKNNQGQMVPFAAFASTRWDYGSPRLERFNGVAAMEVQGEAATGISSGEAMDEIERLVQQLPPGFSVDWSGLSYQERQAGSQAPLLYALSLLVVFLCLAALYESWIVPTAVMLVAPLGILGTVLANTARGMEQDIYFQVAMLATVGLTSKNAILIVEFAKANLEQGMALIDGTLSAVKDRLRPIIMTSLAFGLGVLPLAIATGAGSGAQRAIGTGVLGGMLIGTFLGIFFIPLFFVVVQKLFGKKNLVKSEKV
ncbi:MAG TPA: efflux RND transporter permease subunit [Marinospirillum sp.]|uniref:efflux RND transporter permease subunit n=1 Tax=Marinospirillum sp. TaxID=2183934 RepID=UPI002B46F8F2|nr:efflux RND transporter permease subunit [Marinospirillum sp.]HKM15744.1 efflux RND transporter permease subunit [Marinospirillum sp.]